MRRRINFVNLIITIVEYNKPTKEKPDNTKTTKLTLKKQVVIGDTPLEVMRYDTHFKDKIKNQYKNLVFFMINKMEIIYSSTKTNYEIT